MKRKVKFFTPKPISFLNGLFGLFSGKGIQIKDPEGYLLKGEGREYT